MPRGHKKDVHVTKLLFRNGLLLDRRSFLSLPREEDGTVHLMLKGDDIVCQRQRVWHRSKQRCALCKGAITFDFEMDHIQGGTSGRCDCLHNLRALCRDCHRLKHVRTRFGENNGSDT